VEVNQKKRFLLLSAPASQHQETLVNGIALVIELVITWTKLKLKEG
jgi:hypothetical protein